VTAHAASAAFTPGRLGPVTLRNRVVETATFEGARRAVELPVGVPDHARVRRASRELESNV
jgi:2,4-dienoyl-CoA reductase-like NADH-dependent reductase (Old Yellow Enzyme family)